MLAWADHNRFFCLGFQHIQVELHADDEHEKNESYLAEKLQIAQRSLRENECGNLGVEHPQ
jgi:hypothetical protein